MPDVSPYAKCPIYETEHHVLRLVADADAEDLLECYSDPAAWDLFNKDHCAHDFVCHSPADVAEYIRFWLAEYESGGFVRWSIVDKKRRKAVGTIEMFARKPADAGYRQVGVLRIDLPSSYERKQPLGELLTVCIGSFYDAFRVDHIITKAIPQATHRIAALMECGFARLEDRAIAPCGDYFIR